MKVAEEVAGESEGREAESGEDSARLFLSRRAVWRIKEREDGLTSTEKFA